MQEHIVAMFESDAGAAAAARELEQIGIPASSIRRYRGASEERSQEGQSHLETGSSGGGFWSWLLGEEGGTADLSSPSRRDSQLYDKRVGAGHTVVAVTVADDSQIHRALEVIEAHHPLEIDEETDESGASGQERGTPLMSGTAGQTSATGAGAPVQRGGEETIPLSEEELEVGKRVVDRGTTRIRRYVVETPVEREVTLHGERVTVERRRPATPTNAPGAGAFEERTVEVSASEEEPVVRKNAHVTEEVVVHREDTQRQATVHDTVRREEVEVTGDQNKTTSNARR